MAKVKITVLKKLHYNNILGQNPQVEFTGAPECDRLEVGQEFISDEGRYPTGFCAWAFADIQRDIPTFALGEITLGQGKRGQLFPAVQMDLGL